MKKIEITQEEFNAMAELFGEELLAILEKENAELIETK